jgi:hypothetical protein
MKMIVIIALGLIMMSSSCGQKDTNTSAPTTTAPSTGAPSSSTETTEPKARRIRQVIFFTPSSDDLYQISLKEGEDNVQTALIDEFEINATEFIKDPGIEGVQTTFSDKPQITLVLKNGVNFSFTRDLDKNLCGAIFHDGVQEPKVVVGARLFVEYQKIAKSFFVEDVK